MKKVFLLCITITFLYFNGCTSHNSYEPAKDESENKVPGEKWHTPTQEQIDSAYNVKNRYTKTEEHIPIVDDSLNDEKKFELALQLFEKGDNQMGEYTLKQITYKSPIYEKVQKFIQDRKETFEEVKKNKEQVEQQRENYYNSIFSKYKSRLGMLKKMLSLGFEEYDTSVHSMTGTGDALVKSYGLDEDDFIITVQMWMTYTYEWQWTVSARMK